MGRVERGFAEFCRGRSRHRNFSEPSGEPWKLTWLFRGVKKRAAVCRGKVRMSGLCKVEMSGFIGAGRADGTGANCVEPARSGSVEGVARGPARSSEASRSRPASAADGPARAAVTGTPAKRGRSRAGAPAARTALEPQDLRRGSAARPSRVATAPLRRFRTYAGGGASGAPRPAGEPGDAAAMDGPLGTVAAPATESAAGACLAASACRLRRTGDDGQLTVSLAGGSRPGEPPDRDDR